MNVKDIRSKFESKLRRELTSWDINKDDLLILGISGGADSVALLCGLIAIGQQVAAVHCNFGLRGDESDRDTRFVEELCAKHKVRLQIFYPKVAEYVEMHGVSVEMACRDLRYDIFREVMRKRGAVRICVAHNADDNAETLLLNLMRGSGISGLRGMLPDTGEIIRPLLGVTRAEILQYLEAIGQQFVTDSTNLQSGYRRNFIRNEVIPLLERRWPAAKDAICRSASILREDEKILDACESTYLDEDTTTLSYETIKKCPSPQLCIYRFIRRFGAPATMSVEILNVIEAHPFQSGKLWHLEDGDLVAERESLNFVRKNTQAYEYHIEYTQYQMTSELLEVIKKSDNSMLWLPFPTEEVIFRTREEGDRIAPFGMSGNKLVSKLMKDCKLKHQDKQSRLLAVHRATGEVLWVEGLCRSRHHAINAETEIVYKFCVIR